MVRVGEALGNLLWHGGFLGRVLVILGVAGLLLAIGSMLALLVAKRFAGRVGTLTLLVAAAVMGLAACATLLGRQGADSAATSASDLAPTQERLRRQHYIQARVASLGGLVLGAFPLIAGAGAVMVAGGPRNARRPRAGVGRPAPIAVLVAAFVAALAAVVAARAEIPGRDLDKAAWDLLEHEAQIEAGRMDAGCAGLERDLLSLGRAEAAPIVRDLRRLADACIRHRLAAPSASAARAESVASAERAERVAEVLRSPLVLDEAHRDELRAELTGRGP